MFGHRRDQIVVGEKSLGVEPPEKGLELAVFGSAIAGLFRESIDLVGERRLLDSVEFWYRRGNWGNGQRPKVRLMGIRW